MSRAKALLWLLVLSISGAAATFAQSSDRGSQQEEAALRLAIVEDQYSAGEYQLCRQIMDAYIEEHRSRTFKFSHAQMARIYELRALVAYAFRGEDDQYREQVRAYLLAAVEEDPETELGSPSEIPSFVQELFQQVKHEYLERFSRTRRRFQIGLLGALVIDPTLVIDPSLLQPGLYFSYNLSERFSLISDLRLPLTLPIWKSIRGQVGISLYPYFNITRLNPSIALSYVFSLDNLETYTHSLSLSGQAELISRMGLGAGMRVEVLRVDLILGLTSSGQLPTYRSVELFGESAFRATFANLSFFIFYTF